MTAWRITIAARHDLVGIGRFTEARWGRSKRRQYLRRLCEAFDRLAEHPHLGKPRPELQGDFLSLPVGSHVIFYLLDTVGTVTIVRVLHQSMDPQGRFLG